MSKTDASPVRRQRNWIRRTSSTAQFRFSRKCFYVIIFFQPYRTFNLSLQEAHRDLCIFYMPIYFLFQNVLVLKISYSKVGYTTMSVCVLHARVHSPGYEGIEVIHFYSYSNILFSKLISSSTYCILTVKF
jgi:hypothetical protein